MTPPFRTEDKEDGTYFVWTSTRAVSRARTTFVGRKRECEQIHAWLSERVLVTIVGTAGIGKSRLAFEAASRWGGDFHQIDLSHATDQDSCVARVARALSLSPSATAKDVGRALLEREKPLLLLDDADPVVEPLAALLPEWLDLATELRVITTSRERLRLRSEQAMELGPLSLEGGTESEAAVLFRERCAQVSPRAQLLDTELTTWCNWLQGIPLAIELAAARAPFLGDVEGQRQLDLLRGGFRDAQTRHATLAQAIEWSWGLLGEAEQHALAEAAAFRSGFHVEATTRVLAKPEDGRSALDVLRSLADKSFLRVGADGRLELFDAVREFASETLPEATGEALSRLESYLASQAEREGTETEVLADDILAAADRVISGESKLSTNAGAAILVLAGRLLESQGPARRLQQLMQRGLETLPDAHVDLTTRMRITFASGLRMQGKLEEAERIASEALAVEDQLLNEVRTHLLIEIAIARHSQRNLEGASELYSRALLIAPSRRSEGRLHANLGAIAHDRGDLDGAEASYRKALTALGLTDDTRVVGVVRSNLALLYQERGDLALSKETFLHALEDLAQSGEHYLGAIHRSNLGQLFLELGDLESAIAHHDEALTHLKRIGDQRSSVLCLCRRAAARALSSDFRNARRDLEEASSGSAGLDDPVLIAVVGLHEAFLPLGRAEASEDEDERARRVQDARAVIARIKEQTSIEWRLSDDARSALRILETRLGRTKTTTSEPPAQAFVVGIESRFFRVPGGEWQDLRRQTAARRILEHLIERRDHGSASMADLQAAAWPGERIQQAAATNRVHVALTKLRSRGLKEMLRRDEDGYRLDPACEIHRAALTAPPE